MGTQGRKQITGDLNSKHCHPKGSGSGFGMNNIQSRTTGWQAISWWDGNGQILLEDTRDVEADGVGWIPGFSGGSGW